jgi:hypothetical protein
MKESLGRLFNLVPTGDGIEIDVKNVGAVTFVCVGADTYTVQESTTNTGTNAQDLDVVDQYYENASAVGGNVWTKETQTADAAVVTTAAVTVFTVDVNAMSDGFDFLECTSSAAGLVFAILHDLAVQRAPQNLPQLAA